MTKGQAPVVVTIRGWSLCPSCSEWLDAAFLPLHALGEHPGSPLAVKLTEALTLLTEEG